MWEQVRSCMSPTAVTVPTPGRPGPLQRVWQAAARSLIQTHLNLHIHLIQHSFLYIGGNVSYDGGLSTKWYHMTLHLHPIRRYDFSRLV